MCRAGYADILELVLQSGASVNAKDRYGRTALMLAAQSDYADAAKVLLDHGADIEAISENPQDIAKKEGRKSDLRERRFPLR